MSASAAAAAAATKYTDQGDKLSTCLDFWILTVGSGDGSQQVSIARSHANMVVTFLEKETVMTMRYPSRGPKSLESLRKRDVKIMFEIDARKLDSYGFGRKFDVISFSFPHTGVRNQDMDSISSNQRLICDFLRSASKVLKPDGEIYMTVLNRHPYVKWDVGGIVANLKLNIRAKRSFDKSRFPGYAHRTTKGALGSPRHRKEVEDHSATEYILSPDELCTIPGNVSITLCVLHPKVLSDKDVEEGIFNALRSTSDAASAQTSMSVLEIRRTFPDELLPETRQLNRTIYCMEKQGKVRKTGAKAHNSSKPMWTLC